ncbi:MAG: anaerobic ribonucleoside-triphosphate reductase activating protein [Bacteroidales bacterium]
MIDSIRLLRIVEDTVVDGPGFRTAVYGSGCSHRCKGCHNPHSWELNNGVVYAIRDVADQLLANPVSDVTFTGGDPFYQAEAFTQLAELIKKRSNKKIWCYTGYCFEEIATVPQYRHLLSYIDVLVDGPFQQEQHEPGLLFRGSRNQRLIDVRLSLAQNKTVEWNYNPFPVFEKEIL